MVSRHHNPCEEKGQIICWLLSQTKTSEEFSCNLKFCSCGKLICKSWHEEDKFHRKGRGGGGECNENPNVDNYLGFAVVTESLKCHGSLFDRS